MDRTAHQTVLFIACTSDSEILVTLKIVKAVARAVRHRFEDDKVSMLSVGWTWQGLCLDPCWFE